MAMPIVSCAPSARPPYAARTMRTKDRKAARAWDAAASCSDQAAHLIECIGRATVRGAEQQKRLTLAARLLAQAAELLRVTDAAQKY